MPVRLFDLRDVPDDEADEVRELLSTNGIGFYETSAGNWGISVPAIWLHDAAQQEQAEQLIAQYQKERFSRARDEYEQSKREGQNRTFLDGVKQDPIRFFVYLAVVVFILILSIKLFVDIGQ